MSRLPYFPWDDDSRAMVKSLWTEGLSSSQIAAKVFERFGHTVSRNSIIGLIHRQGLAERSTQASARARLNTQPVRLSASAPGKLVRITPPVVQELVKLKINGNGQVMVEPPQRPAREVIADRDEPMGTATVLSLEAHMCKWPIGNPGDDAFRLCGRRRAEGPYCAEHHARAYVPTPAKQRTPSQLARSLRRFTAS